MDTTYTFASRSTTRLARLLRTSAAAGALLIASPAFADGACCLEDGTCAQMSFIDCYVSDGLYAGEGTDCLTMQCAGACCLPDGTCQLLSEIACNDANGQYHGNGVECGSVMCNLTGACCLGDAGCVPGTTYYECTNAFAGTWMGLGSECIGLNAVSCEGSCCFDDRTCESFMSRDDCAQAGGQFNGFGSTCTVLGACDLNSPNAVNAVVQHVPFNFVMISGANREFLIDKFDNQDGALQLLSVSVEISGQLLLVAVLHNNGDAPIEMSGALSISEDLEVRFSENIVGMPVEYASLWTPTLPLNNLPLVSGVSSLMPGTSTAFESPYIFAPPNDVNKDTFDVAADGARLDLSPFVAADDDSIFTVTMRGTSMLSSSLQGQGSFSHAPHRAIGDIKVRYEYAVLRGACCLSTGGCLESVTRADCEDHAMYESWTLGVSCATAQCDADAVGACCLSDGTCVGDVLERTCMEQPMVLAWHRGVTCKQAANLCTPVGACCLCDGQCFEDVTERDCNTLAGDFGAPQFHAGMSCADVQEADLCSPLGACCVPEGPDGFCMDVSEEECATVDNAIWQPCVTCATSECEPVGACYVPFATCHVMPESECLILGGSFFANASCQFVPGSCDGDASDNGFVDLEDLLIVLAEWGGNGPGDLNDDQIVDLRDLLNVIANWGNDCTSAP